MEVRGPLRLPGGLYIDSSHTGRYQIIKLSIGQINISHWFNFSIIFAMEERGEGWCVTRCKSLRLTGSPCVPTE